MASSLIICGQKSWNRLSGATLLCALLFAVLLALIGLVVGGVAVTASGSANEQEVVVVMGHVAPCCDQPSQKTYHDGSGMHIACAFCVPIPQSVELAVPPTTGSDIFQRDFALTLSRNAAPEPFPPKIIQTV